MHDPGGTLDSLGEGSKLQAPISPLLTVLSAIGIMKSLTQAVGDDGLGQGELDRWCDNSAIRIRQTVHVQNRQNVQVAVDCHTPGIPLCLLCTSRSTPAQVLAACLFLDRDGGNVVGLTVH